jgi:hypothetical protein
MSKFLFPLAALISLGLAGDAVAAACNEPGSIVRVRNTVQGQNEYVIFKFHKPPTVPSYTVKGVSPPFTEDGSGDTVTVGGAKFTEVRFTGVVWTCSIDEQLHLPRPAIVDIKSIGQFEGIIAYIVGRKAQAKYISNYSYDSGPGFRSIVVHFRR